MSLTDDINAAVRVTHSLSYQLRTRIYPSPFACVTRLSKTEECGLPIISLDTTGSSQNWRTPSILPSAASLMALLTASASGRSLSSTTRSTTEPFWDRYACSHPVQLPASCGSIRVCSRGQQPVVVGIIFSAAARLRRVPCVEHRRAVDHS